MCVCVCGDDELASGDLSASRLKRCRNSGVFTVASQSQLLFRHQSQAIAPNRFFCCLGRFVAPIKCLLMCNNYSHCSAIVDLLFESFALFQRFFGMHLLIDIVYYRRVNNFFIQNFR